MLFRRQNGAACRRYEAQLEDYLEGRLSTPRAAELEAHLRQCDGCRQAVEAAREATHLFELAQQPAPEPNPGFARGVMAKIHPVGESSAGKGHFWRPLDVMAWRLSWSALVALAALVAFLFGVQYSRQPQSPVAQGTKVQDLFPEPAPHPANQDDVLLTLAANTVGSEHGR